MGGRAAMFVPSWHCKRLAADSFAGTPGLIHRVPQNRVPLTILELFFNYRWKFYCRVHQIKGSPVSGLRYACRMSNVSTCLQ